MKAIKKASLFLLSLGLTLNTWAAEVSIAGFAFAGDFYSAALARQMTDYMNLAMRNTHIPGSQTPMLGEQARTFHVLLEGQPAGPFSDMELTQLVSAGKLAMDSYVWRPGMPQWQTASQQPDMLRLLALAPPTPPKG